MGHTSISGVEAVGPAAEETAHVVHPARPEGGPAPAGGRLRAFSRPAGRDRLSPPLQARSRQGVQPCRPRPAPGLSQTPALARREVKRSGKRPERSLAPRFPSEANRGLPTALLAPRFPGRRSSGFRRRRAETALRRLPRGPPGTVVFPGAVSRASPPAAAPGRAAWCGVQGAGWRLSGVTVPYGSAAALALIRHRSRSGQEQALRRARATSQMLSRSSISTCQLSN
ncbi:uncharacterized protein [Agelaius tricolor]|uniref:uncharacterized protein n=1 Tax=Agelaius tricolor TaxID=9191 RepID=UPI0039F1C32B